MLYTQIAQQPKQPITVEQLKDKLPNSRNNHALWTAITNMEEEHHDYIFEMTKDGEITAEEVQRVVQTYHVRHQNNAAQEVKQEAKEDPDQSGGSHLPVFQSVPGDSKQLHSGLTEYGAQTAHGTWRIGVHVNKKEFGLQCQITFEKNNLGDGECLTLYQAVSRLRGGINDVANQKLANGIQSLEKSNVRLTTADTIIIPYAKILPENFLLRLDASFTDKYVMAFMDTTKTSNDPAYDLAGQLNWGQGGKMGGVAVDKTRKPQIKEETENSKKFEQILDNIHIATLGDRPKLGDDGMFPTYRGAEEDKAHRTYKAVKQRSQLQSGPHNKSGIWFETTVLLTSKDGTSTYLGSILWGFEVQRGKVENVFPRVLSKDTPTRFFQQAATAWNDQASTNNLQRLYAPWDE